MYTRNPHFWVVSPGCSLSHFCLHSSMPTYQDEDEGAAEELSLVCHHTGYLNVVSQAVDALRSSCEPPTHSGISSSLSMTEQEQSISSPENQRIITEDDQEETQRFIEGCWNEIRTETHQCVDAYEQRDPEGMSPFWGGPPLIYYGMVRNVVFGVDVVEEVSVEDTLEVITEDVFADGLIDPEFLQEEHLYPT